MSRGIAGDEVGRNDPCPCGSGKKYKKCCMGKAAPRRPAPAAKRPGVREQLQAAAGHAQAGRLEQAEQAYEQVLAARAERAEYGVAVVVGFEGERDADDAAVGADRSLQCRFDGDVGAEAVDALPRRPTERRDEALAEPPGQHRPHRRPNIAS